MTEELPWDSSVNSSVLHQLLTHAIHMADLSEYTVGLESSVAFTKALKAAHDNGNLGDDTVAFIIHHYKERYA